MKNPPASFFWRWVLLAVKSFLSAHQAPSPEDTLIRVDLPLPTDVIRLAFWIELIILMSAIS
jgi:hypothetical protein